jgi:ABC-type enterochelin transport system permease subunit
MILFILELLLMLAAPVSHVVLCILNQNGRIKLSIINITIICLLAGILLPSVASYIDIINLPSDVKCATGSVGFAVIGTGATVVLIPMSTLLFYIIAFYRRKKNTTSR